MAEPLGKIIKGRVIFLLMVVLILLFQVLPLNTGSALFAAPDFILVLTFAFVTRYPLLAAPAIIVFAILLSDFVLQRPPGLWALVVLGACLVLRARAFELRHSLFGFEWATVAVITLASFVIYHFALVFTFLPTQDLRLAVMQAILTILFYPLGVWVLGLLIRDSARNPRSDTTSAKSSR